MFRWLPTSAVSSCLSFVGKLPQGNFKSYHMPLNYFVRQFSKAVPPSLGVFGWKAAQGDVWTCLRRRWARSRALSGGAVSTMSSKWAEINLQNCTLFSSVRSSYSHPDLLLTPLFQITPVLNTGLSLSEPLQLYKGYNAL